VLDGRGGGARVGEAWLETSSALPSRDKDNLKWDVDLAALCVVSDEQDDGWKGSSLGGMLVSTRTWVVSGLTLKNRHRHVPAWTASRKSSRGSICWQDNQQSSRMRESARQSPLGSAVKTGLPDSGAASSGIGPWDCCLGSRSSVLTRPRRSALGCAPQP